MSFKCQFHTTFFTTKLNQFVPVTLSLGIYSCNRSQYRTVAQIRPFFHCQFFISCRQSNIPLLTFQNRFNEVQIHLSETEYRECQITPLSITGVQCMVIKTITQVTTLRIVVALVTITSFGKRDHCLGITMQPIITSKENSDIKTGLTIFIHVRSSDIVILRVAPSFCRIFPL